MVMDAPLTLLHKCMMIFASISGARLYLLASREPLDQETVWDIGFKLIMLPIRQSLLMLREFWSGGDMLYGSGVATFG